MFVMWIFRLVLLLVVSVLGGFVAVFLEYLGITIESSKMSPFIGSLVVQISWMLWGMVLFTVLCKTFPEKPIYDGDSQ